LPQPYQIAWLGTAPLAVYGIQRGQTAPIWPQGHEEPLTDPFYPPLPAPGQYVISATQLQGVYLKNRERFAWFQAQQPRDRINDSLFVYDVAASGPAVGLGVSGIGPAMIAPADYAAFQTNDVTLRWFDARTSFLWSGGAADGVWTAVGDGHLPTHPLLTQFYPPPIVTGQSVMAGQTWRYDLYEWDDSPLLGILPAEGTAVFSDTLELFGYKLDPNPAEEAIELLSIWRVIQPPAADLKIFVHLLDADGQVVAQHDGMDVAVRGLQSGDEFAQLHTILLTPDLPSETYVLQIGLYRPEDGTRLPVLIGDGMKDRVLLQTLTREP
jgi:hypothetical protein